MPEDRYAAISHATTILRLIRAQALTRAELAEHMGLHDRTIRRLIEALIAADVPIEAVRRSGAGAAMEYRWRGKI